MANVTVKLGSNITAAELSLLFQTLLIQGVTLLNPSCTQCRISALTNLSMILSADMRHQQKLWNMPTDGLIIEKHFCKNLGLYFTDGFGSDGSVVKGLRCFFPS